MTYTILNKPVGPVGYGLMSLALAGLAGRPLSDDQINAAIKAAIDSGATYLNGGQFYGTPERNSLTMLKTYFERYPEDAAKVVVNIKGGMAPNMTPAGDEASIARSIEYCLSALGPGGRIDQFEAARKDPNVPYDVTLSAIQRFVDEGKIGGISCSELGPQTLREAARKFKITALEIELSLFRTEPLTNGILDICAEFDIPVLAYSPLGKGFLTGEIQKLEDIPEGDHRRMWPQFSPENFGANLELVKKVQGIAARKGCTPGQVAISWLVSLSGKPGKPTIIPIPGSTNPDRIRENAKVVELDEGDLAEIDEILQKFVRKGDRYPGFQQAYLDA